MGWLSSLADLPVFMCAVMCTAGAVLALLSGRRTSCGSRPRPTPPAIRSSDAAEPPRGER